MLGLGAGGVSRSYGVGLTVCDAVDSRLRGNGGNDRMIILLCYFLVGKLSVLGVVKLFVDVLLNPPLDIDDALKSVFSNVSLLSVGIAPVDFTNALFVSGV